MTTISSAARRAAVLRYTFIGFVALSGAAGLILWAPLSTMPVLAGPAQDEAAGTNIEMVGEPWVGDMGITETVEEIMARDALLPPWDGIVREAEAEDEEHEGPDRADLPQDPDAPDVSQWPPPDDRSLDQTGGMDVNGHGHGGGPDNPQTVGTSFVGANLSLSGFIPPDTKGDIGPTQILVCVNGRIRVYDKSGVLGGLNTTTDSFFTSVRNGSGTSDPRVRFDRISQRWFVLMINVSSPNRVLLAVSSGATITGTGSFTFYQFQQDLPTPTNATDTGGLLDYPSLGVDANALYTAGNMFNSSYRGTTGFVIRKTSVLSGGPIVVSAFRQMATASGNGPYSPRGVNNDDASATEGYFIGVDNAAFSRLVVRRVSTPGGTPTLSGNLNITVPTTTNPLSVPAMGSTTNLETSDDRLFAADMHKNRLTGAITLWSAHHIQVDASGVGSNSGGRDGARWYQLQNMTTTPALVQSGTLFDSAASNPKYYFYPAAMMSGQGHMAIGASYAGGANFAGAAVAGRLSSDTLGATQAPTFAQVGAGSYTLLGGGRNRWGDYSLTNVDPADDMTFWTFQEYADATNSWAARVIKLIAPPPATPASCSPSSVGTGTTTNVIVTGTSASGSGFFDPDVSFPNHITSSVSGTGVTVNSTTFTDPTHVTINITVTAGAATGARNVTVTNPDGQAATGNSILTITGACSGASITTDPSSQTVCSGGSVTFTVVAGGTAPFSYQWRKNGSNIGGATNASFTINPVAAGDAGSYDCVATNACGSATSNAATLTVNTGPSITGQPSNQTACSGGSATFTVSASGTPAPTFQWRKNSVNIGGATSSSFTINPVGAGDAASYDCVVTNSCGSATSSTATLTVNTAAAITGQPSNQTVCSGGSASFTVTASGTPAPTFQWRKGATNLSNGGNISGATTATLTINPAGPGDAAANYNCVVTNSCGSATSNNASLTVNTAAAITVQPTNQTACAGGSATFSVTASGSPAPTYQWRKNGSNIGGATNSSFTINPVTGGDAGNYDVVVTNTCGSVTSNTVSLTVNTGPAITVQPTNQSACTGGSATFSVTASGSPAPTYQWRKNGSNIGGATNSSFTINPVVGGDAANYDVVVTNTCGSVTSNTVSLTVNTGPAITQQPTNQSACEGGSATFTVVANGTPPLSYQWRKNGSNIGGATNSSFTINPVTAGDAGSYDVVVTNACGSSTTDAASLTVNGGPIINTQPANQSAAAGGSATFSVVANGTPPLNYQWRKNGSNLSDGGSISGATTASLTINPVAAGDAGNYDVVVSNACGSTTSNVATLTVTGACQPCDANCDGSINGFDIGPFLDLLSGTSSPCAPCSGDSNADGSLNQFDIQSFIQCLGG